MITLLSNKIRIIHPDDKLEQELTNRCTLENPEFKSISKYGNVKFSSVPEKLCFYEKDESSLIVPRGCLNYLNKKSIVDMRTWHKDYVPVKSNFKLRDYQKEALNEILKAEFGVIKIPPGGGKTIIGIALACALKQPTLFLVHTDVLFKQTVDKIPKLTNIAYAGEIRGKKFLISDFITVATIQSMRYLTSLKNFFSIVIVDECHHTPARTFTEVVTRFNAKYVCGLTATPFRNDGLEQAMFLNIGPILFDIDFRYLMNEGFISEPTIKVIYSNISLEIDGKRIFDLLLKEVIQNKKRNNRIINEILNNETGGCLVLSARVAHCKTLIKNLKTINYPSAILVGQDNPEPVVNKLKSGEIKCVISTFDKIGEGLDVHNINKLILATPFKSLISLEQAVGRVVRPSSGVPVVVDFIDNHPYAKYLYNIRNKFYESNRFPVKFTA